MEAISSPNKNRWASYAVSIVWFKSSFYAVPRPRSLPFWDGSSLVSSTRTCRSGLRWPSWCWADEQVEAWCNDICTLVDCLALRGLWCGSIFWLSSLCLGGLSPSSGDLLGHKWLIAAFEAWAKPWNSGAPSWHTYSFSLRWKGAGWFLMVLAWNECSSGW